MSVESLGDLWWKNAVIYCLDVETFHDANGDGIGDFRGLSDRLDYLAGLGVTCLWLMPFYPSDQRDDGYDITDYYTVDPRLGDLGEFTDFMRMAGSYGMKVIVDLVVNHTSDQHPWFQESRRDPDSPFRDFYVWRDEPPEDWDPVIVFPGEQDGNWAWDEARGQHYLHHFYPHQPDLNYHEPAVRDEITKIIGFWTQQGIAGFRVDAVPYLAGVQSEAGEEIVAPHDLLRDLRSFMQRRKGDSVLLGEANLEPHELVHYLEGEDELQLAFNFYLNQHVFLGLARRNPDPVRKALASMPSIPQTAQWANFLKNHDELTLDKLPKGEREEVFAAFGPKPGMQIFDRGIRRRVPSMFEGDPALIRLAYSLMFSLPGTPVLFYGEEIGMGENLHVEGRYAVRTPMQWLPDERAGFSLAPPEEFPRPVTTGGYGPEHVNVSDQQQDSGSLLNWMTRLIRRRRETPEIGMGSVTEFDCGDGAILALKYEWLDRVVIVLHSFADRARRADLSSVLSEDVLLRRDLWSDRRYEDSEGDEVRLNALGYRWIRLVKQGQETIL